MMRRPERWVIIGLPAGFLIVFLLVPLALMVVMSIRPDLRGGPLSFDWSPTLDN